MSYEVLVAVVAINALLTASLWRQLTKVRPNRPQLNKKAAKALWHAEPIVPKHDPPKKLGGEYASLADDYHRAFLLDFGEFADVVNWWLADEFTASRFRLEDLPDSDLRLNVDYSNGPTLGRAFAIYYNQTKVGRLEVRPIYGYTHDAPKVSASIVMDWARFIDFDELTEFFRAVALHVARSDSQTNDYAASIHHGLIRTLWESYRISQYDHSDDEEWGNLSLSFEGDASFYIDRKNASARKSV